MGSVSCRAQTNPKTPKRECKWVIPEGWQMVYNKFYKDYAILRGTEEWLGLSLQRGLDYGIYGELDRSNPFQDTRNSIFKDSCLAKGFLKRYLEILANDNWKQTNKK